MFFCYLIFPGKESLKAVQTLLNGACGSILEIIRKILAKELRIRTARFQKE